MDCSAQYRDNVAVLHIGSPHQKSGIAVRQHYKVTKNAHCHKSVLVIDVVIYVVRQTTQYIQQHISVSLLIFECMRCNLLVYNFGWSSDCEMSVKSPSTMAPLGFPFPIKHARSADLPTGPISAQLSASDLAVPWGILPNSEYLVLVAGE